MLLLLGLSVEDVTYIETKFMNFDLTALSMLYHHRKHEPLGASDFQQLKIL